MHRQSHIYIYIYIYTHTQSSRDNSISEQMPDTTAVTQDVLYSRGVVPMVAVVVEGGSVTAIVNVNMQVNYWSLYTSASLFTVYPNCQSLCLFIPSRCSFSSHAEAREVV